jgi:hypothetical protein
MNEPDERRPLESSDEIQPPDDEMTAPRRTDRPRIEFVCPNCRVRLAAYHLKCPSCGIALDELYSGQYQLRRGPGTKVAAWIILAVFALCIAGFVLAMAASGCMPP